MYFPLQHHPCWNGSNYTPQKPRLGAAAGRFASDGEKLNAPSESDLDRSCTRQQHLTLITEIFTMKCGFERAEKEKASSQWRLILGKNLSMSEICHFNLLDSFLWNGFWVLEDSCTRLAGKRAMGAVWNWLCWPTDEWSSHSTFTASTSAEHSGVFRTNASLIRLYWSPVSYTSKTCRSANRKALITQTCVRENCEKGKGRGKCSKDL